MERSIEQLEAQVAGLTAALRPLYEHCRNNLQICGIVERARAALADPGAAGEAHDREVAVKALERIANKWRLHSDECGLAAGRLMQEAERIRAGEPK